MIELILILGFLLIMQLVGGILSWFFVKKFCRHIRKMMILEVILMCLVSCILIYEGMMITDYSVIALFVGIVFLLVLNKFLPHKHITSKSESVSLMIFVALCLHKFPEGMAFVSSIMVNQIIGFIAVGMMALHNIPEGFVLTLPYFCNGKFIDGMKALFLMQLVFIIGALSAYVLFLGISIFTQALIMCFAAGAMLYIAIEEIEL